MFCTGFHVHVSNIDARGLGRSHGRDNAKDSRDCGTFRSGLFYTLPLVRHIGKFSICLHENSDQVKPTFPTLEYRSC